MVEYAGWRQSSYRRSPRTTSTSDQGISIVDEASVLKSAIVCMGDKITHRVHLSLLIELRSKNRLSHLVGHRNVQLVVQG